MRRVLGVAVAAVLAVGLVSTSALAVTINFDDQGLTGPSLFSAAGPAQTHVIMEGGVTATFNGGVILDNTANLPANQTALYGTAFFGTGLSNPLTIDFDSAITNFFLDVINGQTFTTDFLVSDNAGNSAMFTVPSNTSSGQQTIGFAATGTIVTILQLETGTSNPLSNWDFFIDNISYNEALPPDLNPVPLPAALPLFATTLVGFGLVGWRRRRKAGSA